ncbi:MAG: serine/threonine-protein kinase [Gemmataceae bacterium]
MDDLTKPYHPSPAAGRSPDSKLPADQQLTCRDVSPHAPVAAVSSPRDFGGYELLNEVARGGMGVVYRARQVELNRFVALKMILAGRLANAEDVLRFRTEAEAAGRLKHPSIVAVHDIGEVEGQHFFTMEFIEGKSLAEVITHGPLPQRLAARYVRLIAQAVHHAHKQGIVHRDLKPSNVLIDVDDLPHVTDFGLAKKLGTDSAKTRSGAVLGTPSYMAPEQAEGRLKDIGPGTDVFSLGAILYELITGRPPFRGETPLETILQVVNNDPTPPSVMNANVDHDLETICLKCLEKDPSLRYGGADQLAADLHRYLEGESIEARSFNVLDRLTRMLDRSRYDASFHAWSSMLLGMSAVIAIEHVLVFALIRWEQPQATVFSARFIQFVLLAFLFFWHRGSRLLPSTPAERELWSIWIGYFFAYGGTVVATRVLRVAEIIEEGTIATKYLPELLPYPFISMMSGVGLFAMGANYWGRCYALAIAFFAMGIAMPLRLEWAPLGFGMLWSLTLLMLGLHLRRQMQRAEEERSVHEGRVNGSGSAVPPNNKTRS